MSSEIPPTDYFSGITFNPDFYQSSSEDYLTASTGQNYFLTYPTAQGSETITTLKTSSIESSAPTTAMTLLSNQTANLTMATAVTVTKAKQLKNFILTRELYFDARDSNLEVHRRV